MTSREAVFSVARIGVRQSLAEQTLVVGTDPARPCVYRVDPQLSAPGFDLDSGTARVLFRPMLTSDWSRRRAFYETIPLEVHVELSAPNSEGEMVEVVLTEARKRTLVEDFLKIVHIDIRLECHQRMLEHDFLYIVQVRLAPDIHVELTLRIEPARLSMHPSHRNLHPSANSDLLPHVFEATAEALANATNAILPYSRGKEIWKSKMIGPFVAMAEGRDYAQPFTVPNYRHGTDVQRLVLIPPAGLEASHLPGVTYYRPRSRSADLDTLAALGRLPDAPMAPPDPIHLGAPTTHVGSIKRKMIL